MNLPRVSTFTPWPMLAGAVAAFTFAMPLADRGQQGLSEALAVIGAVLIGAWIVLLTLHGYTGTRDPDPHRDTPEPDTPPDP